MHLGYKISSWAQPKDDTYVWCTACESCINISKGFQALTQHSEKKRHKENIEAKCGPKQLHLTGLPQSSNDVSSSGSAESTPKSISLVSSTYKSDKAELIWAIKCVASNFSGNSCKGIDRVFSVMFGEDCPFLKDFSLGSTKFSYLITEALGPYFKERMLQDAYRSYFSVLYDETTNNEGRKELQIGIKYWSEKYNEVVTSHLATIFMGSAKAEDISSKIIKCLDDLALSLSKLIMIGSDGPPVNTKVFRIINEEVKSMPQRTSGLLQVGTCNLHVVNNSFLKGLEIYGHEVVDLIIGVYYFFHGWPLRNEEFELAQSKKGVPQHRFIKHSSTRWLTLGQAALRLLEQWPAIIYYFLEFVPSKKPQHFTTASSYRRIVNLLQTKSIKAQLLFIISSVQLYSRFSCMFQKQEPLIHAIYDELKSLLLTIMKRICKKKSVDAVIASGDFENVFEEQNLMFSKDIIFGDDIITELKKLPESYQKDFLHNARNHYIESGKYLIEKMFKTGSSNLKYFSFLQRNKISDEDSCQNIVKIAKLLPSTVNTSMLIDEWHLLQTEEFSFNNDRIDHFWRNIFEIKNAVGETKYPLIQNVVKMCLSISHGSADIERGFSLSGRIISENKTNMSEKTLNSKLHIMDALKHYNYEIDLVPITSELLIMAKSANKKYKDYLEQERRQKEQQKKIEDDEKKLLQEKENEMKKIEKSLVSIKELENDLVKVQDAENNNTKVATKLLTEANDRLKEGIKNQDFVEIQLAQAMIESAKSMKAQEDEQRAKALKIEKKLQKRKSSVITDVIKKSKTD